VGRLTLDTQNKSIVHGGGMMASAIRSTEGITGAVFAAGVSNSMEIDHLEYTREKKDLRTFIDNNSNKKIIYLSSYIARDGTSRYAQHKRQMELMIEEKANDFLVLRLPQVVGRTMNRTLISYFVNAAKIREKLTIQRNAFRSLVDVTDVGRIISLFNQKKVTREVIAVGPLKPLRVLYIIENIESILQVKIDFTLVDDGDRQTGDLSRALELLERNDPLFDEAYQCSVLKKYVPMLFGGRFD
jgi:hypothetical protein